MVIFAERDGKVVFRLAHNQQVVGSNPTLATNKLWPAKNFIYNPLFRSATAPI